MRTNQQGNGFLGGLALKFVAVFFLWLVLLLVGAPWGDRRGAVGAEEGAITRGFQWASAFVWLFVPAFALFAATPDRRTWGDLPTLGAVLFCTAGLWVLARRIYAASSGHIALGDAGGVRRVFGLMRHTRWVVWTLVFGGLLLISTQLPAFNKFFVFRNDPQLSSLGLLVVFLILTVAVVLIASPLGAIDRAEDDRLYQIAELLQAATGVPVEEIAGKISVKGNPVEYLAIRPVPVRIQAMENKDVVKRIEKAMPGLAVTAITSTEIVVETQTIEQVEAAQLREATDGFVEYIAGEAQSAPLAQQVIELNWDEEKGSN